MDRLIGERMRARRHQLGMSQQGLAKALGLSFQQVQKYEMGTNRVAASVLFTIARALDVPITYFYEGVEGTATTTIPMLSRRQGDLLRGAEGMPEAVREAFIDLARCYDRQDKG